MVVGRGGGVYHHEVSHCARSRVELLHFLASSHAVLLPQPTDQALSSEDMNTAMWGSGACGLPGLPGRESGAGEHPATL